MSVHMSIHLLPFEQLSVVSDLCALERLSTALDPDPTIPIAQSSTKAQQWL